MLLPSLIKTHNGSQRNRLKYRQWNFVYIYINSLKCKYNNKPRYFNCHKYNKNNRIKINKQCNRKQQNKNTNNICMEVS